VISALYRGIEEHNGGVSGCFNPRHGIRAVKGGRTVDVVICFECGYIHFWESGKRSTVLVTGTPQKAFDRVLESGTVPLGERTH
jgi:hypothetical protein